VKLYQFDTSSIFNANIMAMQTSEMGATLMPFDADP
jgi:hypothetical protein